MDRYNMEDVFKTSGVPTLTYVQPQEHTSLKIALRTAGKCVVVEGPSGIGKTTAVNTILQELGIREDAIVLSARKLSDKDKIINILSGEFEGIVIIDDFHRLESTIQASFSDLMKNLADEEIPNKKLVVVGINQTGNSLVQFSPDLNNRISTIKFESNSDSKIRELISKGETALNIVFDKKDDIVDNACGSFHIAQLMCYKACIINELTETVDARQTVPFSYPQVQALLSEELGRSFFDIARKFATGNRLRREGRAPYLHCLKWLSESDKWTVLLTAEMQRHPSEKPGVTQIVEKGYLKDFLERNTDISQYIHFNQDTRCLAAEDPKFIFYLRTLNWNNFARDIGYIGLVSTPKYDYALSFAGTERQIADKIFRRLQALEINVFYDFNEQAEIMSENVEEYLFPIYNSDAIYVVPLLSKTYPSRVWTKFESDAFKNRFGKKAVIPIWFSDTASTFDESRKYGGYEFNVENDEDLEIEKIVNLLAKKIMLHKEKAL